MAIRGAWAEGWRARAGVLVSVVAGYLGCSSTSSTPNAVTIDGGAPAPSGDGAAPPVGASVIQRSKNATRDAHYVDAALTRAAVRGMHPDAAFTPPPIMGPVYAAPLYVENGPGGKGVVFVATEQDIVYALDETSGAVVWQKTIGTPVPIGAFDCANMDPVGITGTPVIDLASRTLLVNAMTSADGGATKKHMLHALSIDDGSERSGYPVDLVAKLAERSVTFYPQWQQQRAALALVNGHVYIPFGGFSADCGTYHGFILGVAIGDPTIVSSWSVKALDGGIWGVGGPASDGTSLFVSTGNTDTRNAGWGGGDAIMRLDQGPTFSGDAKDYFVPSNWAYLDEQDLELGGSQPILIDMPGAAHPNLVVGMGKNGNVYVQDRSNLGGLGHGDGDTGEGLASMHATMDYIINAGAAFTGAGGTYVVFKGQGVTCPPNSTLMAVKIGAADPPTITPAWCASPASKGSPVVSTTDGHSEGIVWTVGSDGDGKLNAFDAETGEVLFDGGQDSFPAIAPHQSAILVHGRAIWAANEQVFAYTVH